MKKESHEAVKLLDIHYLAFHSAKPLADQTDHPVPCDTRAWSQILVSLLTGIPGMKRKKGADLADGSDVKAANVWSAIDTPRFNGVVPAGRMSGKKESVEALYPNIYFVMWDYKEKQERCRVWCVNPKADTEFKKLAGRWYSKRGRGEIRSSNFQLHPPRNLNTNLFRNTCGNLEYPLLFEAVRKEGLFTQSHFDPSVVKNGKCKRVKNGKCKRV